MISVKGLKSSKRRFVGVIVDPDAPSRTDPTRRSIRHYLAPDLTVGENSVYVGYSKLLSNATYGTPAANDFRGPNPPIGSGPHRLYPFSYRNIRNRLLTGRRYIFFLYSQPVDFDYSFLDLNDRASFNLSSFAERTGLEEPLAGTYFLTEVVNATTVTA